MVKLGFKIELSRAARRAAKEKRKEQRANALLLDGADAADNGAQRKDADMSETDSYDSDVANRYENDTNQQQEPDRDIAQCQRRALNGFNQNGTSLFGYGQGLSLYPREDDSDLEDLYELEKQ